MTIEENVTRKLTQMLTEFSPRLTEKNELTAASRGHKRARILEAIGQTVLPRTLAFSAGSNGEELSALVLEVSNSRVTAVSRAEPASLGALPDLSQSDREEAARQLGAMITAFSRETGGVFLQSSPPETAPDAEDVGITLSELLAVVTVEDLPDDVVETSQKTAPETEDEKEDAPVIDAQQPARAGYLARFYDAVEAFSPARAEIGTDGEILRQSEPDLMTPDLTELLARDLQEWQNDSGAAIAVPQLIVMRPEKPRDPAIALYRTQSGTVISVHETRKLGSVVSALKGLRQADEH